MTDAVVSAEVKTRLMIVDDDASVGRTLLGILKKAGYDAEWAPNGREALAKLSEGQPADILLVDIRLPDMNGLDIFREARKKLPDLGAIVMTGYSDTETAVGALNAGAFAYVQKPYNIDEVKASLARLAERQGLLKQNRELVRQLQDSNAVLERRVAERTRSLQTANLDLANTIERLKEADTAKSAFVSMVSHELRTPLTVIEGFTETLIDKLESLKRDEIVQYLDIIHTDTLRLTRLIQNILDLSQMQAKGIAINPAPVRLKALAESVVRGLEVLNTGMKFEIGFEQGEVEIVSDKDCVEQILVNLLSNAVKYSPKNSSIRIEGSQRDGTARICVIDQGPGIAEAEREKIFQAFYRCPDVVNSKTPGTGLGLTITRAIVEALEGRIQVSPGPSAKGSSFQVTLPRKIEGEKSNGSSDLSIAKR